MKTEGTRYSDGCLLSMCFLKEADIFKFLMANGSSVAFKTWSISCLPGYPEIKSVYWDRYDNIASFGWNILEYLNWLKTILLWRKYRFFIFHTLGTHGLMIPTVDVINYTWDPWFFFFSLTRNFAFLNHPTFLNEWEETRVDGLSIARTMDTTCLKKERKRGPNKERHSPKSM